MSVLLYSSQANDAGTGLQRIVETLVPNEHIEVCQSVEDLSQRLRQYLGKEFIGVFLAADQKELSSLLSLRNLLIDIRFILVLPDSEESTVKKGLSLYPRFLSYADGDLSVVAAVLNKMLRVKHYAVMQK